MTSNFQDVACKYEKEEVQTTNLNEPRFKNVGANKNH